MKKYYVVGFLFSENHDEVVLIKKAKPEWQKGLMNGVGGKIELFDDSPEAAMTREFEEEAGVRIEKWDEFMKLEGWNSVIYFFRATGDTSKVKTMEDSGEEIVRMKIYELVENFHFCVHNIRWIVPLALTNDNFTGQIKIGKEANVTD